MNQIEDSGAPAPTSYGLPVRIDGMDTARLQAVLTSAGASMANFMHETLERLANSPAFLAAVSNLHAELEARGFIPTQDEPNAEGDAGAAHTDQLMREALSAVSWLYRRLPRGYGRQQHIEVVIERLALETGTGIDELVERAEAEGGGHG